MSTPMSQLVGSLPPGTRLFEYRIDGVLGHGGFGITYLAHDTNLEKTVAIKEYLPSDLAVRANGNDVSVRATETQEAFAWGRHHFLKEARVLARFSHYNLIQVHRFFETNATAYFVMEYAQGTTLAALLKDGGTMEEARLRDLLLPVMDGLEAVHREGILHRDIKPDNIMLRADGSPVLIDFGAARQNLNQMTRSVLSVLTAGYAPLEQYASEGNQGPWTDVYALAAVAYRAITGKRPMDAVNRVRDDPLVPAVALGAGKYSPHFLAAVDWGLRVDAEDRPENVTLWRRALEGAFTPPKSGTTPPARRVGKPAAAAAVAKTQLMEKTQFLEKTQLLARKLPQAAKAASTVVRKVPGLVRQKPALSGGLVGLVVLLAAGFWWWRVMSRAVELPPDPPAEAVLAPASAEVAAAPSLAPATESPPPAAEPPARQPETVVTASAPAAPKPAPKKAPARKAVAQVAPLASFQDCPQCPTLVALPPGQFVMGAAPGPSVPAWEGPPHPVAFGRAFAIGRDEVTAAQWQACVVAGACPPLAAGRGTPPGDIPAVNVSWDDAQRYVQWLSNATQRRYRLPTEAEWEYASRGGTTTARYWGDSRKEQCAHANGADQAALQIDAKLPGIDCNDGHAALAPAGTLKPNAFGLFHVAGNAWEWTQDCWRDGYTGAPGDGAAVEAPNCTLRVIRGGSWRTKPESLRSSGRGRSAPGHRGEDLGFRVVAE